jgi:hypothetical protein
MTSGGHNKYDSDIRRQKKDITPTAAARATTKTKL